MKRIAVLILILALFSMPFSAQAISLSNLAEKPEPTPRPMPEPTVENIPHPTYRTPDTFLGRIELTESKTGLGYEFKNFSSDPWVQMQELIKYDNCLVKAGYDSPSFNSFDGENQRYLCFSGYGLRKTDVFRKTDVYLLPYLKENSLIAVIMYNDDILDSFPEDMSAEEAYAALIAKLDDEDTRDAAAKTLAAIWKTPDMKPAVTDKITAENMEALLPALIRADYFTRFEDSGEVDVSTSVEIIGEVIRTLIASQESTEAKLSLVKRVTAGIIIPAVDERYLQISSLVWNISSYMQSPMEAGELPVIPAFDKESEIADGLTDDGAAHKYVVICEEEGSYSLLPLHSLFLPADEIAESVAEADRIIVCHNYYEKSSGIWIGGTPNDSITRIDLYDADGKLICNIGSAARRQGGASTGNISHNYVEMGEVISQYFAEK